MTKAEERKLKEQLRLQSMTSFERPFWENGILVAGMDEVGRGPLAGPVVAACVVMRKEPLIEGVNDSKKVSEHKRERLYDEIRENALAFGFGWEFQDVIDEINILQADYRAMKRAIAAMKTKPQFVIGDAVKIPDLGIDQNPLVKADAKVAAVAAASIIAKVTRDYIMRVYDSVVPEYGFAKHKAYGTKAHYEAIEKYGILPIHRRTFLQKRIEAGKLVAKEREVAFEDPNQIMNDFLRQYGLPD